MFHCISFGIEMPEAMSWDDVKFGEQFQFSREIKILSSIA